MNMGIADAVDIGWKLSAVLSGWGGEKLLASYEAERRQIHRRVIEESVANHAVMSKGLVAEGLEEAGSGGEGVRSTVAKSIQESKRREFHSLNVVLGSSYTTLPTAQSTASLEPSALGADEYVPSARAGCLAPHFWLGEGRLKGASLYDQFATDRFTLLVTTQEAAGSVEPLVQTAAELRIPLRVLVQTEKKLNELYGCDLALIRPDQYVAWSGNDIHEGCGGIAVAAGISPNPAV